MEKALRSLALLFWLLSFAYLIGGVGQVIAWSMRSPVTGWRHLPPLSSMEFPEYSVIAIALAGIVNTTAFRLGSLGRAHVFLRKMSGWLVLVFGLYLMIAKGLVCLISADGEIARLHQVTVFASMLMALAGMKALLVRSEIPE
jgi:hypothetical protein